MAESLYVTMFGDFSIARGDVRIDDSSNRMRKVWLLLAYLIYHRRSRVTQETFLSLLESTGESDDPVGRLKALLYRIRSQLDKLGEGAGHDLILRKEGSYRWNTEIPLILDVEEFDRLYTEAAACTGEEQLILSMKALALYRGDFLSKLSMESWIMPIHAYYHQRYLELALQTLSHLRDSSRWQEAETLCRKALEIEPYSEELYQHLMFCQIASGNRSGAVVTYETMSQLLFDTFGVLPSDDSRKLYREACKEDGASAVSVENLRMHLQETGTATGAVFCEYDFFKLLYQVQARSIIRSGEVIHIALMSLHGTGKEPLARRSADRAMENLKALMIANLRQGDVLTQCSATQFIIMLPQANYENSCMVCQRIVKAFCRQYPHSPAQIHYSVHPLTPTAPGFPVD